MVFTSKGNYLSIKVSEVQLVLSEQVKYCVNSECNSEYYFMGIKERKNDMRLYFKSLL